MAQGDGRYFISNGKDQCIKLWDLRKMTDHAFADQVTEHLGNYDYRFMHEEYLGNSQRRIFSGPFNLAFF